MDLLFLLQSDRWSKSGIANKPNYNPDSIKTNSVQFAAICSHIGAALICHLLANISVFKIYSHKWMMNQSLMPSIALLRPLAYEDNNYFVYVCAVGILPIKVANYRYIWISIFCQNLSFRFITQVNYILAKWWLNA